MILQLWLDFDRSQRTFTERSRIKIKFSHRIVLRRIKIPKSSSINPNQEFCWWLVEAIAPVILQDT